ncbi:MAG TPA: STAS domain-containing protein [Spirochaetota bacterium]|jgi:anti-sigma B factor antagonist|nr:STAS domain-containing protein [Spirochaetota bacterium]HOF13495.1 STAS domain-containing protein [Spirochaetota bacterium]HOM87955.1 STAS domain-containing protein [Spirochaetota bacterium]HOR93333.1 STAS domain-containing protein [Spirochaetota bacterium]HOT19412.1 STAS domain-containing protein [Spirochaetota bacterium]
MEINLEKKGNTIDIKVKGDIEMMTIKEFKEKLLSIGEENDIDITLDLSEVDYIDSSGVGVLISLNKIQKKKGKKLELAKVSPKVLNVLKLSSLSEVFNL